MKCWCWVKNCSCSSKWFLQVQRQQGNVVFYTCSEATLPSDWGSCLGWMLSSGDQWEWLKCGSEKFVTWFPAYKRAHVQPDYSRIIKNRRGEFTKSKHTWWLTGQKVTVKHLPLHHWTILHHLVYYFCVAVSSSWLCISTVVQYWAVYEWSEGPYCTVNSSKRTDMPKKKGQIRSRLHRPCKTANPLVVLHTHVLLDAPIV